MLTRVPQILRDNVGDTRVVDDVAALAAAYDDEAVAAAAESARQIRADDLALLRELFARDSEPAAPLGRRIAAHVGRHRTYYVVGALVLAVLLFRSPEPLPTADAGDEATHVIPTADANAAASGPEAPVDFPLADNIVFPFEQPTDF